MKKICLVVLLSTIATPAFAVDFWTLCRAVLGFDQAPTLPAPERLQALSPTELRTRANRLAGLIATLERMFAENRNDEALELLRMEGDLLLSGTGIGLLLPSSISTARLESTNAIRRAIEETNGELDVRTFSIDVFRVAGPIGDANVVILLPPTELVRTSEGFLPVHSATARREVPLAAALTTARRRQLIRSLRLIRQTLVEQI